MLFLEGKHQQPLKNLHIDYRNLEAPSDSDDDNYSDAEGAEN